MYPISPPSHFLHHNYIQSIECESISALEQPCAFAKISLNSQIIPDESNSSNAVIQEFLALSAAQQLERAERHTKAGKKSRYLLFDTEDPGGISIEGQNRPNLKVLSPRLEKGYYTSLVGITLYDEDQDELRESLRGLLENSAMLIENDSQHRMLIVLVMDGLFCLLDNPMMMDYLAELRLFSLTDIISFKVKKSERLLYDKCYAFESRLKLNDKVPVFDAANSPEGTDVLMVIKHENMRKLHSHLWLFYGFGFHFLPEYVFVLDAGTKPKKDSIIRLLDHMDNSPTTGGACGEIKVKAPKKKWNLITRAQWFEFKLQHILVKTFESVCGFIPVLPGAFSVYRWSAFIEEECAVLKAYLKPFIEPYRLNWVEWNMYFLAEDRVASEAIIKLKTPSQSNCCGDKGYFLRFVKKSKASTQAQVQFKDLIAQRRRWNNGAWFALINVMVLKFTVLDIIKSAHGFFSLIPLLIQFFYYALVISFQWFSLGAYYFVFVLAARVYLDDDDAIEAFRAGFLFLDFVVLCFSLTISLKYISPQIWGILSFLYALSFIFILFSFIYYFIENGIEDWLIFAAIVLAPVIVLTGILLYCEDYCRLFGYSLFYVYMLPTYANILLIFAISRTDDVTWGTRNHSKYKPPKNSTFKQYKVFYLLVFVASNVTFGLLLERTFIDDILYLVYVLYILTLLVLVMPFFGECFYLFQHWCCCQFNQRSRRIKHRN